MVTKTYQRSSVSFSSYYQGVAMILDGCISTMHFFMVIIMKKCIYTYHQVFLHLILARCVIVISFYMASLNHP